MRFPCKWGAALHTFCECDPIIGRRVEIARSRRLDVPTPEVESPRVLVVGSGRCFDYQQSGVQSLQPSFNLIQENGSASRALRGWMHCDPVEIVRAIRSGRRPVAGKASQLLFRGEGAEEDIVGAARSVVVKSSCTTLYSERCSKHLVEQLDGDVDFIFTKDFCRHENVTNPRSIFRRHVADENPRRLGGYWFLRRKPDHGDTASSASIPESRSERCHSSGLVSIFCASPASHTRRISAL